MPFRESLIPIHNVVERDGVTGRGLTQIKAIDELSLYGTETAIGATHLTPRSTN